MRLSQEVAREYLAARGVIAGFLADLCVGVDAASRERLAETLIARLAAHDPPILIDMQEGKACAARLWNEGGAAPRTCERCGIGPCPFGEVRRP